MIKNIEKLLYNVLNNEIHEFKNHVFSIGGCVRDEILKIQPKDIDIVIDIKDGSKNFSEFLYSLFPNSIVKPFQKNNSYPIYSIVFNDNITYNDDIYEVYGYDIDVAETHKERFLDKDTRQRITTFGTFEDDIYRRDFTINTLAKDLTTLNIIDYTSSGLNDLYSKIIKTANLNSDIIFFDDPLRILRMIRFSIKYNFSIEENTFKSAFRNAERIKIISKERILEELKKICEIKYGLYKAINLMIDLNIIQYVFPFVSDLMVITQQPDIRNIHLESNNVFGHTMEALKYANNTFIDQMAVLFHDIGKINTKEKIDGKISFLRHEVTGIDLAKKYLKYLKVSNNDIDIIIDCISKHMMLYNSTSLKTIRKLIRICPNTYINILNTIKADDLGTLRLINDIIVSGSIDWNDINEKIEKVKNENSKPISILNGYEIMELLNISSGVKVGIAKNIVNDIMDEYGDSIDKEKLKQLLKYKFFNED